MTTPEDVARDQFAQVAVVVAWDDDEPDAPNGTPARARLYHYRSGQHGGAVRPDTTGEAAEHLWLGMLDRLTPSCPTCPDIGWTGYSPSSYLVEPFNFTDEL